MTLLLVENEHLYQFQNPEEAILWIGLNNPPSEGLMFIPDGIEEADIIEDWLESVTDVKIC